MPDLPPDAAPTAPRRRRRPEDPPLAVGERIEALLAAHRIRQVELAELVGISKTALNPILVGRKKPGRGMVARIAMALGLPPRWVDADWTDAPDELSLFESFDLPGYWHPSHWDAVHLIGWGPFSPDDVFTTVLEKCHAAGRDVRLRTGFPPFSAAEIAADHAPPLHAIRRLPPLIHHYRAIQDDDAPDSGAPES